MIFDCLLYCRCIKSSTRTCTSREELMCYPVLLANFVDLLRWMISSQEEEESWKRLCGRMVVFSPPFIDVPHCCTPPKIIFILIVYVVPE
jgi:hypothetical protein